MQDRGSVTPLVVWVPTPYEIVRQMLTLAGVGHSDVVYDLGSGDGRLLISAVKDFGAKRAVGYELRQDLCSTSRRLIREHSLQRSVKVVNGDLRDADLSAASVITLYLSTEANHILAERLRNSLREGCRVVTYLFPISGWLATSEVDLADFSFTEGRFIGKLYLYLVPPAMLPA